MTSIHRGDHEHAFSDFPFFDVESLLPVRDIVGPLPTLNAFIGGPS